MRWTLNIEQRGILIVSSHPQLHPDHDFGKIVFMEALSTHSMTTVVLRENGPECTARARGVFNAWGGIFRISMVYP